MIRSIPSCAARVIFFTLASLSVVIVVGSITEEGFGYVATTDVSQILKLALDIRDMRAATDLDKKKQIYLEGANAKPYSLASLSLNSSQWTDFPMYNIYKYAFYELGINEEGDEPGFFDDHPIEHYADTIVNDLFLLNRTHIEADGALILNVVMAYWGSLYQMLQECERQSAEMAAEMSELLDQAAALWVGEGQVRADNVEGYMLYNLAERTGTSFVQDGSNGESEINRVVLETFVSLKQDIEEQTCNAGESGYGNVREKVKNLIKYTNVVLVQMFLHHVEVTKDSDFVELFSLAILPQIAACDSVAYENLLELTIDRDVTDDTKTQIISSVQGAYSCLDINCRDVGAYEGNRIAQCEENATLSLAGYVPVTDFAKKAQIDRDIRHIRMFMKLGAYNAVKDYYNYGWNTFFSLRQLATSSFSPVTSEEVQRFQQYFSDDNFAENMIMNVLEQQVPFDATSTEDRTNVVVGVLEGIVMYLSMTSELESSILACKDSDQTSKDALSFWDGAAAFYIGSLEGETESLEDRGQLLFGLAKSLCEDFKTCETNDAAVNEALIDLLEFGRNSLADGACQEALRIVQTEIKPYLLVPLIQATLYYTANATKGSSPGSAGALHAFSRSILPAVNEVSTDAAAIINSNSDFDPDRKPPDIEAVFDGFRTALASMETDCRQVGELTTDNVRRAVCEDDVPIGSPTQQESPTAVSPSAAPTHSPVSGPPSDPSGLAWGRYTFVDQAVAENDSKFSLDVKDMFNSADVSAADSIYSQKSTNVPNGLSGGLGMFSLSDFSTKASSVMTEDPLYNFYRLAFYDDDDFEERNGEFKDFPFADTVVRLALSPSKGNSQELASVASVVMNCLMIIVHRLYEAVRQCRQQVNASSMIDAAVGLWIGQEQAQGKFDGGWMLYSHAQRVAKFYGNEEEESDINTELMTLFNSAQATAIACANSSEKYKELSKTAEEIIRALSKILARRMLFHISEDNHNYVELYALAFVPQAIACDEGSYKQLRDMLFLDFDRASSVNGGLISRFGKVLQCLRFTCSDLGDVSNANGNLRNLVASVCSEMDLFDTSKSIAGYETDNDVSELARLDLDILQIELFMRTRAYDLAADYYINGHNSLDGAGNRISLQSLATDAARTNAGETYELYQNYFQSDTYADDIILSLIQNRTDGVFASASRRQLSEAAFRTLQTMVPYMHIVSKLRLAISQCEAAQSGQQLVDEAAALFVGSMEGPDMGGDTDQNGKMLFALGKETCAEFGKCESNDDATANEFVLVSLRDMKRSISSNDCSSASEILKDVVSMLAVPMVQGSVSLAVANEKLPARSDDKTVASGFILAEAVLPLVKAANQTSASTILDNMDFNLDQKPVIDGSTVVFDAFKDAFVGMGISCDYIGSIEHLGLSACGDASVSPGPGTPTNLGDDLFVTTTYVQDRANIALDVKAMEEALSVGREALARIIYEEGDNSAIFDDSGVKVDLRSLAMFSTNASQTMKDNPLYQIAVYALRDANGLYLGQDAWEYADTIVQVALTEGAKVKSPIAAEAAVALNLWMELANELFQTLKNCKNGNFLDDDGIHSIDEAAAYWIGDGQVAGDSQQGHLLYALAERMGEHFQIKESGQSRTNVNILRLLHQAKIELSLPDACSGSHSTFRRLRHIMTKITTQMIIVNMQALIHNLRVGDRLRVHIYSHAVVPLIAGCSPATFSYLREKLIDFKYNETEVDSIIDAIGTTFPCFDIKCEDIGVHTSESASTCVDPDSNTPLAGYRPATDVTDFAKLDLDIHELDILLQMQAYGPAEDLYSYGRHSTMATEEEDRTCLSLEYLATSQGRSAVSQFDSFKRYYGEDDRYADTIVRYALMPNNRLGSDERRSVVVGVSQYMILYMAALESMQNAADACDKNINSAALSWDTAAAWLIGHMEGMSQAGSSDGRLFWALAKQNCKEFRTCSDEVPGSARVNDEIVSHLYEGLGAALEKRCGVLREATAHVSSLLPIPLIQAALSTAVRLQRTSGGDRRQRELLAQGYVYSQAILPLIQDVSLDAAATIASSFDLVGGSAILPDGVSAVVSAYTSVLSGLGIDCKAVGDTEQIDTCAGTVQESSTSRVGLIVGIIVAVVGLVGICFLIRAKHKTKKEEEKPVFLKPKGELNHSSEIARNSSAEDSQTSKADVEHVDDGSTARISGEENENSEKSTARISGEEHENSKLQVV